MPEFTEEEEARQVIEMQAKMLRRNRKRRMGLYDKYVVLRMDHKHVHWAFVLEGTDPLAIPALEAYAKAAFVAGYFVLSGDLKDKIEELKA